jgi:hypothetical protein
MGNLLRVKRYLNVFCSLLVLGGLLLIFLYRDASSMVDMGVALTLLGWINPLLFDLVYGTAGGKLFHIEAIERSTLRQIRARMRHNTEVSESLLMASETASEHGDIEYRKLYGTGRPLPAHGFAQLPDLCKGG